VTFRVFHIAKILYSLLWCCQDTDGKNQGLICTTLTINCNFTDHGELQKARFSQNKRTRELHLRMQEAATVGFKVSAIPLSKKAPESNTSLHPV
jgi:hypothetical protein